MWVLAPSDLVGRHDQFVDVLKGVTVRVEILPFELEKYAPKTSKRP